MKTRAMANRLPVPGEHGAGARLGARPGREAGRVVLWLFVLLLLANGAFFGVMQLARTPAGASGKDHLPLNADKIRLVAPPAKTAPSPATGARAEAPVPVAPAAPKKPPVCLQWGPFAGNDLTRAAQSLKKLQLGDRLSREPVAEARGYWVYIPPLGSKQEALAKIAELKQMGITDYLLIQGEGKWQYAISLGVLSTEAAAKTQLARLRRKGVASAQAGPRTVDSNRASFLIRDADDPLTAKLVELKQGFPGSELQAVPCP